ncbi:MAG: HWE histidine kinase domain-containing protein, partial [Pseudomonadota bacterium]
MASELSDQEMREALETCASEPVHIPGCIQPFGCMLAVTAETGRIAYVSENAEAFIGRPPRALLGADASDALGRELWHGVRNAAARSGLAERAVAIGAYEIQGQFCDIRVFASGGCLVVEMEPAADPGIDGNDALSTLGYLMFQIQACTQEQRLFELTVELMRHLSGYDRVLIYRFDREFNGEVLAEAKSAPLEGFLGLRFPHWDIPSQAREIMKKVPLRLISDVEQVPVPILSAPGGAPLDITLAASRGVSPVHMEYLRNMGSGATMTLSIMVEEKLWGIISFHHRRPKLAPSGLREVLVNFLAVFNGKLLALRQQAALGRIEMLDRGFVGDEAETLPLQDLLPSVAPVIMEVMNGHGFAVVSKSAPTTSGIVPGPEVLQALSDLAISRDEVIAIESLSERFPHYEASLNTVAGALLVGVLPDRAICIFRNELAQEVSWAGSPEKRVETVGDRLRLSPRGSFSVFLEEVRGRCEPWTQNDLYLIRHIRTLLHAAERQAVMDTLNRQQTLMIGELNHRVRNILALVRSVSRQARRRYGSLNSYANAIENRIRALAAAHDIGGGKFTQPVSLRQLIQVEFEPF